MGLLFVFIYCIEFDFNCLNIKLLDVVFCSYLFKLDIIFV